MIGLLAPGLTASSAASATVDVLVANLDSDATVVPGEYVSATVTVFNVGTSSTGSFDVLVAILATGFPCTDGVLIPSVEYSVGSLAPFAGSDTETVSIQWPAGFATGEFQVCAVADWNDDLSETIESNNDASNLLTVNECATSAHCDDGNACTTDSCNSGSCVNANNSNPCEDLSLCTTGDTCSGGVCTGGPPVVCPDDGNSCTDAICVAQTGCGHITNTDPCNDSSACTTGDTCSGGTCVGAPVVCDDSNGCTDDSCDPGAGCTYADNTNACDDLDACTKWDTCSAGSCAGAPLLCDDGLSCTMDACNASNGFCEFAPTCGGGAICTSADVCESAPLFTGLGGNFKVEDVSADGLTAVGNLVFADPAISGRSAGRWRAGTGAVGLGSDPALAVSDGNAVSADGDTIVGSSFVSGVEAFIWTASGGLTMLGTLGGDDTYGNGVSDDGSTAVGQSTLVPTVNVTRRPFRWTSAEGMVDAGMLDYFVDPPDLGEWSFATAASEDGSTVVGTTEITDDGSPLVSHVATRWAPAEGFLGQASSYGADVSADGDVIVGQSGSQAFRWTPSTGMQGIGLLPGGTSSSAAAISADGRTIVGAAGDSIIPDTPFIWDAANGMRELTTVLTDLGLDLTGWTLNDARGISSNGGVIVGRGINPEGDAESWMVVFDDADGDGVLGYLEEAAPNGGDGNGDGTADSLQPTVASTPAAEGAAYITIEVSGGCASLMGLDVTAEASMAVRDPLFSFPFGLIEFRIACPTATVTIYFHGTDSLLPPYRKYGPIVPGDPGTTDWYTLDAPGAVFGTALVGGQTVATATLTLVDGALGDDTAIDGVIVDMGGPAVVDPSAGVPALGGVASLLLVLALVGGLRLTKSRRIRTRCTERFEVVDEAE